jgi:hypothetical protein
MSKRQRREPRAAKSSPASPAQQVSMSAGSPTRLTRNITSCLIVLHFAGLIIALSANIAPSFLHGEALRWLAPVHVSTGQDYIMLPLELTQATDMDAPVVVEVMTEQETPSWQRLSFPNDRVSPGSLLSSRWSNLARLMVWISQQQPDSEVLPELALRAIRSGSTPAGSSIDLNESIAIRFVQPHVLSYDEDLVIAGGRESLLADALEPNVVYAAQILHGKNGEIALVPSQDAGLTSKPIATTPKDPSSGSMNPGQGVEQ